NAGWFELDVRRFASMMDDRKRSLSLRGSFWLLPALAFALVLATALPRLLRAQGAAPSTTPAQITGGAGNGQQSGQQPSEQTIHIEVKEVQIPFSVFDKKGNLVLDLKKGDFKVLEDGVEQEVTYFNQPANLPLRFGILIDTSSSARARLKFEKEAAMSL